MKKTGMDRAVYCNDNCWPSDFFWHDGKNWHSVVMDSKTGIAFTAYYCYGMPIPRHMLAELLDDGFEP